MEDTQRAPYLVYVLRLWRDGQETPWRAALECARTGERLPFADLPALFAFLAAETQAVQAVPVYFKDTGQDEKSQP